MTPQLVDLDADGYQDMVMATFEGTAFVLSGSEKGWSPPKHIKDKNGDNVRISMYYDMEKDDYSSVDRSTDEYENNPDHHMTSIALVDWDEDGDLDLLLGAYEGALYLCMNEGTQSKPIFSDKNQRVFAGDQQATIKGGLATPRIADWNGDGLFDILCGGAEGGVYLYQNVGEKGKPKFDESKTLVSVPLPDKNAEDDGDSGSYYESLFVPAVDGQPTRPGKSFHIEVVDYDKDGDLDLLVGAQSYFKPEKVELAKKDKEKLEKLRFEMAKTMDEMQAFFVDEEGNPKPEKELNAVFESKEFEEISKKYSEIYLEVQSLEPDQGEANYIWIYRNKAKSKSSPTGNQTVD
ncbi:MAG: VCBS repeat-containing protein [Planctomycetota bacterium]